MSLPRPATMDDDCSLDDVHHLFRKAHSSYGVSKSATNDGASFCAMSVDLTAALTTDDESSGKALFPAVAPKGAPRLHFDDRSCAVSVAHSVTPSVAHSVAPSVVRSSSALTHAAASANSALAKLETFLRSDGTHASWGDDACSLFSEMSSVRDSERILEGLWTTTPTFAPTSGEQDMRDEISVSSWKMIGGDEPSVMTDDFTHDEGSVMVGSIMGSVMLGSIMEGHEEIEGVGSEGSASHKEFHPSHKENEDTDSDIEVQSTLSLLSMEDEHHDGHEALPKLSSTLPLSPSRTKEITSRPPALKRLSVMSSLSCSSGVMKELLELYDDDVADHEDDDLADHEDNNSPPPLAPTSPVTFITFDSSSSSKISREEMNDNEPLDGCCRSTSLISTGVPTLESYQESTEVGDEIFYSAIEEEENSHSWCNRHDEMPVASETLTAGPRSLAVPARRKGLSSHHFKRKDSLTILLRYTETMAEFLYGW